VHAVIWTTTPWTLPANKAIAVHPDIVYTVVRLHNADEFHILSRDQLPRLGLYEGAQVVGELYGSELVGCTYRSHFGGEVSPVVDAQFVQDDTGTGLVHIAPAHGMEDYQLCMQKDISIVCQGKLCRAVS
jgi:isoleucyl-tRNA synthetase